MTAAELDALPPSPPGVDQWLFACELVERRNPNVYHSPAHAGVVATVGRILGMWANRWPGYPSYQVFGYGCPYRVATNPDTLVSFDASIACLPGAISHDVPWVEGPPALAVEVVELDEDTVAVDRLVAATLSAGGNLVWVIDPFENVVTVHRPDRRPQSVRGPTVLSAKDVCPGFRCKVAEIFE